jgi:hypothetical protein
VLAQCLAASKPKDRPLKIALGGLSYWPSRLPPRQPLGAPLSALQGC